MEKEEERGRVGGRERERESESGCNEIKTSEL
jgi:hypothetical protein